MINKMIYEIKQPKAALGPSPDVCEAGARTPEIVDQVRHLEYQITEVASLVRSIEERFGSVIALSVPKNECGGGTAGQVSHRTELGGYLAEQNLRLEGARLHLLDILSRAEI